MTRRECLDNAANAVLRDREKTHGPPQDVFSTAALFFTGYLRGRGKLKDGEDIEDFDVGILDGLQKIARISHNTSHADSYVDMAGYAACSCELATSKTLLPAETPPPSDGICGQICPKNFRLACTRTHGHAGKHFDTSKDLVPAWE